MSKFAIFPAGIPVHLEASAGTTTGWSTAALVLVVGFDGSRTAQRALDAAVHIANHRHARLEVVYVTEEPTLTASSSKPVTEGDRIADETARQLSAKVRTLLGQREQRWRFHHRKGKRHDQLLAAANEISEHPGTHGGKTIVIVVGNDRRTAGSVTTGLLQESPYPLVLVP